jgi:hypothetical protein
VTTKRRLDAAVLRTPFNGAGERQYYVD